jgi:hypothetical protein
MEHIAVKSTNIRSVGYNLEKLVLEIDFHHGGLYQYLHVQEAMYQALMASSSKGKYFDQHIREKYQTIRLR